MRRPIADLDRQHVAHDRIQLLFKHPAQAGAFHGVVQLGVKRVNVHRQAPLAPQVIPDILIRTLHVVGRNAQLDCQRARESFGIVGAVMRRVALIGEKRRVGPNFLFVGAPVNVQRPTRELLAWVPLALPKMQETALTVLIAELFDQLGGKAPFSGAKRIGIPFGGVPVTDCHKGGFTAHGQAHVAQCQFFVNRRAERHYVSPLFRCVGLGHSR